MRYSRSHLVALLLLSLLSLTSGTCEYHLHKEEVRRTLVAFEMYHRGDPFQPTVLGEPYFNKPPLFNWTIAVYSWLLGWHTFTPRAVTLTFTLLTVLALYLVTLKLLENKEKALLSSLLFATFADVLFWYGWMAEIEMSLTFVVSLMILFLYFFFQEGKKAYLIGAGVLCGVGFSVKGFPAFAFFGLTFLSLSLFYRKPHVLFSREALATYAILIVTSLWWVPLSQEPMTYLMTLWRETFSRVESARDLKDTLTHLITYPLLNLKQTLPASLFVLYALLRYRALPDRRLKPLLLVLCVNYLPYLISPESRGRYVLPLFPLLALIFSDILLSQFKPKVFRLLLLSVGLAVVLRLLYGVIFLPYAERVGGDPEKVAVKVVQLSEGRELACGCEDLRDVCLYAGMIRGRPLYSTEVMGDWDLVIDCKKRGLPVVAEFSLGGKKLFVHSRYNHSDEGIQR
ncbi:MAG: glycosyltransferase family 39 protein [Aquificota bacterium]|nr:glycosyltransferase family 39 protein [Aquificota bacterium]